MAGIVVFMLVLVLLLLLVVDFAEVGHGCSTSLCAGRTAVAMKCNRNAIASQLSEYGARNASKSKCDVAEEDAEAEEAEEAEEVVAIAGAEEGAADIAAAADSNSISTPPFSDFYFIYEFCMKENVKLYYNFYFIFFYITSTR